MKSLNFIKFLSFLFVLSLMIVSCTKEGETTIEENPGTFTPTTHKSTNDLLTRSVTSEDGLDLDCFTVLFPFEVVDESGESYVVTSEEEFFDLLSMDSTVVIVDFSYPITVQDEDGATFAVQDGEELGTLFASCLPNEWDETAFPAYLINSENSCLELVYPVRCVTAEGQQIDFDDEESFVAGLAEQVLYFNFPIALEGEDDIIIAEDYQVLLTALFECNEYEIDTTIWNGGGFEYIGCYEVVFPFTLTLEDGTTVTAANHMEYCDLLISGQVAGFAFPMTLIDEEGQEIVVNSEEELESLLSECEWSGGGVANGDLAFLIIGAIPIDSLGTECYTINWPIEVVPVNENGVEGSALTLNNLEEALDLEGLFTEETLFNVVWPVSITFEGEIVTLTGVEEVFDILLECQ